MSRPCQPASVTASRREKTAEMFASDSSSAVPDVAPAQFTTTSGQICSKKRAEVLWRIARQVDHFVVPGLGED